MSMRKRIRDWWRGYSDADIESLREKMIASSLKYPGAITPVTPVEMKALLAKELNQE